MNRISKGRANFSGCVKKTDKLENFVTNGMIEGKRRRGNQQEKKLARLTKWFNAGRGTDALKATSDRGAWKVMIAYARSKAPD